MRLNRMFVVMLCVLSMTGGAVLGVAALSLAQRTAAAQPSASTAASPAATPATTNDEGITAVYRQAAPAVVNITSEATTSNPLFQQQAPTESTGSGIVLDEQGNILTNNHVVADAQTLLVTFADGTSAPAKIVGRDPGNDLAVIRVDAPSAKLTVAKLGNSPDLQVGESVVAIGNPFGLDQTATHGIISATGRRLARASARSLANLLQTDAPINPGNSGGPLLNLAGEVIGINTAIENPTGQSVFVGVGFAVPIDTARRFLPDMLAGKTVEHPWLGISGVGITPTLAQEAQLPVQQGVLVAEAADGGPAAAAGLRGSQPQRDQTPIPTGGDIITAIDGQAVQQVEDLSDYIDTKNVGDQVTLTILRDGSEQPLPVQLQAWPEQLQTGDQQP